MAIVLDHTIVPARDKEASARFFAQIFGLSYDGPNGHFAPVRVNESLTLDFDNREGFEGHHYAFYIGDAEFDAILKRVKDAGRTFGSGPMSPEDGTINTRRGGRGFYFADLDGHLLEVMTTPESGS
jgi:catechol 2,3-dioxygenase-like lactoylglutathione lyase family enzyme